MNLSGELDYHIDRLALFAPAGSSVFLHIRDHKPLKIVQAVPVEWQDLYQAEAFGLRDPVIGWGLHETGKRRWSDPAIKDPFGILRRAADFGMNFGCAVSVGPITSRSIAAAARADREFSDLEIEKFSRLIEHFHQITEPPAALTNAQVAALRCVASGDRYAAAALRLKISESALKARLAAARSTLMARTTAEAVQRARDYGLL